MSHNYGNAGYNGPPGNYGHGGYVPPTILPTPDVNRIPIGSGGYVAHVGGGATPAYGPITGGNVTGYVSPPGSGGLPTSAITTHYDNGYQHPQHPGMISTGGYGNAGCNSTSVSGYGNAGFGDHHHQDHHHQDHHHQDHHHQDHHHQDHHDHDHDHGHHHAAHENRHHHGNH